MKSGIAMTGELSLTGKVLPIGGLKEKSLAARRMGVKNVIIPIGNACDIENIPETVRKDLTFYPVESVEEVFELVLLPADKKQVSACVGKVSSVNTSEITNSGICCKN